MKEKSIEIFKTVSKGFLNFIKKIWNHKQGRLGFIIVLFLILIAIFADVIAPYDPYDVTQRDTKGLSPSLDHLL
ncbi:MAG: hypothetical protein IKJ01_08920, partial [Lachnospiraceae bacterium]|nr:hypothetical protein [Lachnospiraceae bacterium]